MSLLLTFQSSAAKTAKYLARHPLIWGMEIYALEAGAEIEAGVAEAGVSIGRSAGGSVGEVELAGTAGQNIQVELRGAKFAAKLEAVTALLPRNRVVILKDVVDEGAGAIAGGVDAIAGIVVAEARENRVAYALEAELGGPVRHHIRPGPSPRRDGGE